MGDMTNCALCKESLGLTRGHVDDAICPVRAAWFCDRCGNYGHKPATCDEINHVAPAEFYEDLIRLLGGDEELERRGLANTKTPLPPRELTLEVAEREIAETNTIEVVFRKGNMDSRIRKVMGQYKIRAVHSIENNLKALRNWAVRHGKKVRLVQEK